MSQYAILPLPCLAPSVRTNPLKQASLLVSQLLPDRYGAVWCVGTYVANTRGNSVVLGLPSNTPPLKNGRRLRYKYNVALKVEDSIYPGSAFPIS